MAGKTMIPLLAFAAWSGTGKTTLLKKLIPALCARGIRPGLIKHTHHDMDVDKPGKDSYELRKAGAAQTIVGVPLIAHGCGTGDISLTLPLRPLHEECVPQPVTNRPHSFPARSQQYPYVLLAKKNARLNVGGVAEQDLAELFLQQRNWRLTGAGY